MLLKLKLATSGFVTEETDVDFLNTYFESEPVEEDDTESESDEDDIENEELIPDRDSEIHRIDEESRRLDEIYFGVR